jgi:hypothetical protein
MLRRKGARGYLETAVILAAVAALTIVVGVLLGGTTG